MAVNTGKNRFGIKSDVSVIQRKVGSPSLQSWVSIRRDTVIHELTILWFTIYFKKSSGYSSTDIVLNADLLRPRVNPVPKSLARLG